MPEFKPYFIIFVSVIIVFALILAGAVGYLLGSNNKNNTVNSQLNSQQPSISTGSSGQFSPIPAGKCGDGVCGPVEKQIGVCSQDCGQTSSKTNNQPDNSNNSFQSLPQKQFQPSFPLFQPEEANQ